MMTIHSRGRLTRQSTMPSMTGSGVEFRLFFVCVTFLLWTVDKRVGFSIVGRWATEVLEETIALNALGI